MGSTGYGDEGWFRSSLCVISYRIRSSFTRSHPVPVQLSPAKPCSFPPFPLRLLSSSKGRGGEGGHKDTVSRGSAPLPSSQPRQAHDLTHWCFVDSFSAGFSFWGRGLLGGLHERSLAARALGDGLCPFQEYTDEK